jgi:CelD/BcsL family acetyltransferase involved in cellulose biosynthesis
VSEDLDVRPSHVTLRFALGDLRLVAIRLAVHEVHGHFLEKPVRADFLRDAYQRLRSPVFGRSVVVTAADQPLPDRNSVLLTYRRHYVDLKGNFAAYLARFSSRTRSTLQRKVRKLETQSGGTIDWTTFRTSADVPAFLDESIPLSHLTYQHRLFHSGLPATDSFRSHLVELALRNQWRAWILRLNRQPIAYVCSPGLGRTLLYDYVGFDPRHASLSPGSVLQYLILEQLFAERQFAFFDFTEGEGEHKSLFGTDAVSCADIIITGPAVGPAVMIAMHRAFNRGVRMVVGTIEKAGLKARLRQLLRR